MTALAHFHQPLSFVNNAKRVDELVQDAERLVIQFTGQLELALTAEDCWRLYSRLIHLSQKFDALTTASGQKADTV